jgi:hypothetical protein
MAPISLAIAALALGQVPKGAVEVSFTYPVPLALSSTPVTYRGDKLAIISLGEATFVREDSRLSIVQSPAVEVPPGLYGVRWGHMPPVSDPQPPFAITLSKGPWLRAIVKAGVAQYNDVEYRVSCAVYDKEGRLLGTATHTEKVQYVRLGYMPTLERELTFDFGASKAFERVAYAAFSINEPEVPIAPDGG